MGKASAYSTSFFPLPPSKRLADQRLHLRHERRRRPVDRADLVIAARDLGERLIDTGIVDAEQLRFTIVARKDRKHLAPALKANGMSNREIARTLGVSHVTVQNDLAAANGKNLPSNGKNLPPAQQQRAEAA